MIANHDIKLKVEEISVEESIGCGFKTEHMSGEQDGLKYDLCSGAGLGSPWITATVERDGVKRYYRVDARSIMTDIVRLSEDVVEAATGS